MPKIFKINSQLSEDQIATDVSSYLGYITPFWSKRFRLISVDEQLTGADKLFNRFIPIYLQFKVSHGLNRAATILQRFQNKPLANIINYRNNNSLSGNPILYFPLRRKAKTAADLQHNILYGFNKPPNQYALYVAPLTLDISKYEKQLTKSWHLKFFPFGPFSQRELELNDATLNKKIIFDYNPFLRHHISIPPHTIVSTHNHHYSYSESGGDVAWHSGELLNGDFRLSNQLTLIYNSFYYNRELGVTPEQFVKYIQDFRFDVNGRIGGNSDNPFLFIQAFAIFLKYYYNIKLLLLTQLNYDR